MFVKRKTFLVAEGESMPTTSGELFKMAHRHTYAGATQCVSM